MADENAKALLKKKKLIIMALAGLLLLVGAAGGWLLLRDAPAPVANNGENSAPVLGPVLYIDLPPSFIVNFPYQGRQRFLQADITVMSRDPVAIAAVSQHLPAIRHNLINLLNAQLILIFENPDGVELLRQMATQEVRQVLLREIGREGIEEVLFTNFVMQ